MTKVPDIIGLERTDLNSVKAASDKTTASSILGGGNLKAVPLESRTRQGYLLQSIIFNSQISRNKARLGNSLFIDEIISQIRYYKKYTGKLLGIINNFSRVAGYKIK